MGALEPRFVRSGVGGVDFAGVCTMLVEPRRGCRRFGGKQHRRRLRRGFGIGGALLRDCWLRVVVVEGFRVPFFSCGLGGKTIETGS